MALVSGSSDAGKEARTYTNWNLNSATFEMEEGKMLRSGEGLKGAVQKNIMITQPTSNTTISVARENVTIQLLGIRPHLPLKCVSVLSPALHRGFSQFTGHGC
jgi:hypothetical protein